MYLNYNLYPNATVSRLGLGVSLLIIYIFLFEEVETPRYFF